MIQRIIGYIARLIQCQICPEMMVLTLLPREIHRLEPEESCCPECGGELDYP
ncbi:hypothetical protein K8W50_004920, partial [Escherichia coli]|nr:hypothetical protein [Escherichia coli]